MSRAGKPGIIVTLTTDFGAGSPYVAAMKGVMLTINPQLRIVDLTHAIPPQDVRAAAIALEQTTRWFPPQTLHLAVVDPGVGSQRAILYAEIGDQCYICPDNGLLSRLADSQSPSRMRAITNARYFRSPVSATFHGRDIMAPSAAHVSCGLDPRTLGPELAALTPLDWPGAITLANRIQGQVESIDSFGNLITNISRQMLHGVPTDASVGVFCDDHETRGIFRTYSDQPELTLIALVGSDDRLELAIVGESAALMLGVAVGTEVEIRW